MINIKIMCVGKIKDKNLLSLINEYQKRISKYAKLEIIDVEDADTVSIGKTVTVKRLSDGVDATYEIVGFSQSDPSHGKISDESPVGKALMGAKAGQKVVVEAPIGNLEYEILSID